ncbi:7TM-DISM domain-containing protein [Reichenbachiella versicolor]|uniref:7TM-DISM domain-containing protein n=1 Tax=Reichenbachiella versicolor TaxID=1821036 RepID=UPI000D6E4A2E|nr:7TM-DISM domain-containing protein [Reichenbachiella versicolor]
MNLQLWKILFFVFVILSLAGEAKSQERLKVLDNYHLYIDHDGSINPLQAGQLFEEGDFSHITTDNIHVDIADSVIWLALKVDPLLEKQYLTLGNQMEVWSAATYVKDSTGQLLKTYEKKHLAPLDSKGASYSTTVVELSGSSSYYLIRIRSTFNRNYRFMIGGIEPTIEHLVFKESIPKAFIAFMLCVILYNTFLFLSTGNRVFIPYLVYLIVLTYGVCFHSGYIPFSHKSMWPQQWSYTIWLSLLYSSGTFFAIRYLNLKNMAPRLYKWLLFLVFVLVIIVPIIDNTKWINVSIWAALVPTLVFILNSSLLYAGIYVWKKGVKHARFYVIGWLFILSGIGVYLIVTIGVIPYDRIYDFTLYFGSAMESVLFAFAIGDQMNQFARQKEKIEAKYITRTLEKNRLLAKQLFMNSHMLRAPISRILGLINLLRPFNTGKESSSFLHHIETSTHELDDMTKKMSNLLENEGYLNQYQRDFKEVKDGSYQDLKTDHKNTQS